MILIDANIFMCAAGAPHEHKAPRVDFLRRVAGGREEASTDAEVLQEILHRYHALDRWRDAEIVFGLARRVSPAVLPITDVVVDEARALMSADAGLGVRDAVHAAVVLTHRCRAICS